MDKNIESLMVLIDADMEAMAESVESVSLSLKQIGVIVERTPQSKDLLGMINMGAQSAAMAAQSSGLGDAVWTDMVSVIHAVESGAEHLASIYSGMETVVERIFHITRESVPKSDSYHRDLLALASRDRLPLRTRILSRNLELILDDYRRFRHVVRHNYPQALKFKETVGKMNDAKDVADCFAKEIRDFLAPFKSPNQSKAPGD